jgi:hypothetical protein
VRRLAYIAMLVALGAALAVPASAHEKRFNSRVTIEHPSEPSYEGDVFSRKDACVRYRMVQFWRDNEGAPDDLVNEVRSDADGHWSYSFLGDAYYARVRRVVKRPADHKHVCKGDRSPTVE